MEYLVFIAKTVEQVKEILDPKNAKYRADKVVFVCRLIPNETLPVFEYEVIRLLAGKLTQPIRITAQRLIGETTDVEGMEALVNIMNKYFPLPVSTTLRRGKPDQKEKPKPKSVSRFFPPWARFDKHDEEDEKKPEKKKNKLK